MVRTRTVATTAFKAQYAQILDGLHRREWDRVILTKRGVAVGALVPPIPEEVGIARLHGFLRGSVIIPDGVDLAEPALAGEIIGGRDQS